MTKTGTNTRPLTERLIRPIQEFIKQETSGGILLLACMMIALILANSPWADAYAGVWEIKLTVGVGSFELSKSLLLWINDGLMAVFFFVVGLEIKRELLIGELASPKKAILPFTAALGGMIVPAAIYYGFNAGKAGETGWGIPMATDIAFALGVLALLGRRAPLALKIFLTALAIVDDLGAVLVIALFYTSEIVWISLLIAAIFFILLLIVNRLGIHNPLVYALLGIGLWIAFLKSGIHATIAGVLLAITIPAQSRIKSEELVQRGRELLSRFEMANDPRERPLNETQQSALLALEEACEHAEAPLQRLEHGLHPWVSFFIMPVFALANAGVVLRGNWSEMMAHPVSLGVLLGLVLGKQIGITAFVWLAVKSKLAELPRGLSWRRIYGLSWLAGIGFTMSLFTARLAFSHEPELTAAKFGILIASFIAGGIGWLILRYTGH